MSPFLFLRMCTLIYLIFGGFGEKEALIDSELKHFILYTFFFALFVVLPRFSNCSTALLCCAFSPLPESAIWPGELVSPLFRSVAAVLLRILLFHIISHQYMVVESGSDVFACSD